MGFFNSSFFTKKSSGNPQLNIAFPSVAQRDIIKQAADDMARINNTNRGAVLVNILTQALIPFDGTDAFIYQRALEDAANNEDAVHPYNSGIAAALEIIYDHLSSGVDRESAPIYGLPYVQFGYYMAVENDLHFYPRIPGAANPRVNLYRDFNIILRILNEDEDAQNVGTALAEEIISDRPKAAPYFQFILRNWDNLGDKLATYSFLVYLISSCEHWDDTPEQRMRLRSVCSYAASELKADKALRKKKKDQQIKDAILEEIPLAYGDTAILPNDWVLLNPGDTATSSYVGVIEIKNCPFDDFPHFAFFLNHPAYSLTDEEHDRFFSLAAAIRPELHEIKEAQVELKYNSDGGLANYDEYCVAPRIGFFNIQEENETTEFNPAPYGALIRRARKEEAN